MDPHSIELTPPITYVDIDRNEPHSVKAGRLTVIDMPENVLIKFFKDNYLPFVHSRNDLFKLSLENVKLNGLFLEFGVYKGGTIRTIADLRPDQIIYGFDSWEGFPEDYTPEWSKGTGKCPMPTIVPKNVVLIQGFFENTLQNFLEVEQKPVSFIHIDCDLYSATKYVFETLVKWMKPGVVIQFDELFELVTVDGKCYWWTHELDAWNEFVRDNRITFRWLGTQGSCCSVIIDKIGK